MADQQEFERSIDEFITRGYYLKSRGENSANLKKKDWGDGSTHFIIFLLTIWWTFGFANAIFAVYKRLTAEEVTILVDHGDRVE